MSATRLMLIANRTCPCPGLSSEIHSLFGDPDEVSVHVVAPALNSRVRSWFSDEDEARAAARRRLDLAVAQLNASGFRTSGEIGDAHPLLAIEDSLATYHATELLISTWPEGRSNWLERDLVNKARTRFAIPVHHLVSAYDLAPLSPL